MPIKEKLLKIQIELKAPKAQENKFGNFMYRSCEDILEAVKPLLEETKTIINLSDEVVLIGERFYLKATAKLQDIESSEFESATSFAREPETKKGMDEAQITGATSSYARKYALNGLFGIDDQKDSDSKKTSSSASSEKKVLVADICSKIEKIKTKDKIEEFRKWIEKAKGYNEQQKNIVLRKLEEQEKLCE